MTLEEFFEDLKIAVIMCGHSITENPQLDIDEKLSLEYKLGASVIIDVYSKDSSLILEFRGTYITSLESLDVAEFANDFVDKLLDIVDHIDARTDGFTKYSVALNLNDIDLNTIYKVIVDNCL